MMIEPEPGGGSAADPADLVIRAWDLVDADLRADRRAVHAEPRPLAVVGLDQDADGVAATIGRHHPRRRPDPALELVADHPGPAADVALGDRPAGRRVERRPEVLGAYVEAVDVIEQAVVRLADDGQRPPGRPRLRVPTEAATRASRTTPTLCVLVMAMGVVSFPDSRTHSRPVSSPLPLRR